MWVSICKNPLWKAIWNCLPPLNVWKSYNSPNPWDAHGLSPGNRCKHICAILFTGSLDRSNAGELQNSQRMKHYITTHKNQWQSLQQHRGPAPTLSTRPGHTGDTHPPYPHGQATYALRGLKEHLICQHSILHEVASGRGTSYSERGGTRTVTQDRIFKNAWLHLCASQIGKNEII